MLVVPFPLDPSNNVPALLPRHLEKLAAYNSLADGNGSPQPLIDAHKPHKKHGTKETDLEKLTNKLGHAFQTTLGQRAHYSDLDPAQV